MRKLIIYDFDGVLADREILSNTVLAEMLTELGLPTTLEDSYKLYLGRRSTDVVAAVEKALGRRLPQEFLEEMEARSFALFREKLRPVAGAAEFVAALSGHRQCIASSSSPARIALCLEVIGLAEAFDRNIFSAAEVARGKPHPDIFLHAAQRMGIDPAASIVIEDSPSGVEAAIAAGMQVIGLTAASHSRPEHEERLRAAGAHAVASSFAEAKPVLSEFLTKRTH